MARWCATVGPVLFRPTPRAPSAPITDRVALVTWNVHVGSGDVVDFVHRLRRGEFTNGEPMNYFVLLLQETYRRDTAVPPQIPQGFPAPGRIAARTGRGPDISRVADELGLAVLYVPSMRNGLTSVDAEDRGNAIVANLTLHDPEVVELPFGHQRRAVAVSSVTAHGTNGSAWRVRLADVHLDTALALMRGGPFKARQQQAAALVDALASKDAPTIVGGDFNTWRGAAEPAIALLRRAFPDTPPMPRLPTWQGPLGVHAQLDYVFFRGAVSSTSVVRLPSRFGSDHYPLIARIDLGADAPPLE